MTRPEFVHAMRTGSVRLLSGRALLFTLPPSQLLGGEGCLVLLAAPLRIGGAWAYPHALWRKRAHSPPPLFHIVKMGP